MKKFAFVLVLACVVISLACALDFSFNAFNTKSQRIGEKEARESGLYRSVASIYGVEELDPAGAEYDFDMVISRNIGNSLKWNIKAAMIYNGILYILLPSDASSYEVVVTREFQKGLGNSFEVIKHLSVSNTILMFMPEDEHSTFTVLRNGNYAAVKLTHVHVHNN